MRLCISYNNPSKRNLAKIISQTNIFNIFPCSVPYNTVAKILQNNCVQKTTKYVPVHSMWLNRVFIDLANEDQRNCLTVDCSNVNKNGPGRHITNADNPEEQVCYFNKDSSDQVYNTFMSKRIKSGILKEGFILKLIAFRVRSIRKLLVLIKL